MTDVRAHVLGIASRGDPASPDAERRAVTPDEAILVTELTDPGTGETFYRPPGGGIEFGESSEAAVVREFREELDRGVEPVGYLGTVENRYEFGGQRGHEVTIVHEVRFDDPGVRERETLHGVDDGGTTTYEATWQPLADLVAAEQPLYPEGIERILRGETSHVIG